MKSARQILLGGMLAAVFIAVAPSARAQIQTTRHARFTRRDDNGRISMTLPILQYCSGKQELLTACWRLRCNFHLS